MYAARKSRRIQFIALVNWNDDALLLLFARSLATM